MPFFILSDGPVTEPCRLLPSGVARGIHAILVEALALEDEPEKVALTALFEKDLGAEEIDFLDIRFKIAKMYGIDMPLHDFIPGQRNTWTVAMLQKYLADHHVGFMSDTE